MGQEAGLEAEGLEALLRLFPGVWLKRREEESGEVGHGSVQALRGGERAATALSVQDALSRRDSRP